MLIKAISPSKLGKDNSHGVIVFDLTAGLAQDSIIMALNSKVSKVFMMERDPIVYILLKDAMRRLKDVASTDNIYTQKDIEQAKILNLSHKQALLLSKALRINNLPPPTRGASGHCIASPAGRPLSRGSAAAAPS